MNLQKRKRIVDLELLEQVKGLPCMACLAPPPSDAHHLKTRAAGGDDTAENCVSLCRTHHSLIHSRGTKYMADQFPCVRNWLDLAGWEWDDFMEHWTFRAGPKQYGE